MKQLEYRILNYYQEYSIKIDIPVFPLSISLLPPASTKFPSNIGTLLVANPALYSQQVTRSLSKICTLSLASVISATYPSRGDQVMWEGGSKAVSTLQRDASPDIR
jgi:hypothetical protein